MLIPDENHHWQKLAESVEEVVQSYLRAVCWPPQAESILQQWRLLVVLMHHSVLAVQLFGNTREEAEIERKKCSQEKNLGAIVDIFCKGKYDIYPIIRLFKNTMRGRL